MRLPQARFTVRRLMIAVILVAVVLGAFEAGRRWERAESSHQLGSDGQFGDGEILDELAGVVD